MKNNHEPRSSSSCAACKFLKRRCTPNCPFAPYFRADEAKKFAKVHKVFGASNVSKILNEVREEQREDTVNSLVYEAEVRLRDPVYGCIGAIASLQSKMFELQHDLLLARARLASYASATTSLKHIIASSNTSTSCSNHNNNNNGIEIYDDHDHHQEINHHLDTFLLDLPGSNNGLVIDTLDHHQYAVAGDQSHHQVSFNEFTSAHCYQFP